MRYIVLYLQVTLFSIMTEILQKIPENSKPTMNEEKQTSENLDSMLDAIKK